MLFLRPAFTTLRASRGPIPRLTLPRPTSRPTSTKALNSPTNRLRNSIYGTVLLAALGFGYIEATDSRSSIHTYVVPPLLRYIFSGDDVSRPGAEAAHVFGLRALSFLHSLGIPLRERGDHPYLPTLSSALFGFPVNAPFCVSAGLDKHATCVDALFALSPAISLVEVGCVTPLPQEGNPKPRVFRLPAARALINRYGFNSDGSDAVARRLRDRVRRYAREREMSEEEVLADANTRASLLPGRLLAVQIGKNRATDGGDMEAVKRDYVQCVRKLADWADVLVVNVSSPNTPGLRNLQAEQPLRELLSAVVAAASAPSVRRATHPKVVVKVSPDSDSPAEISAICDAVKATGVAGVIVANTTVSRPPQLTASPQTTAKERGIAAGEAGGLSGPALFGKTVALVREFRERLGSDVEVLASGGISSGADAMKVVEAGASAVMAYTSVVYGGVGWFGRAAEELAQEARRRREV